MIATKHVYARTNVCVHAHTHEHACRNQVFISGTLGHRRARCATPTLIDSDQIIYPTMPAAAWDRDGEGKSRYVLARQRSTSSAAPAGVLVTDRRE
jgi:hypothetical protein